MGVDIVMYRARIGLFGPGHGRLKSNTEKLKEYSPYCCWSDVHYRVFVCSLFTLIMCLYTWVCMCLYCHIATNLTMASEPGTDYCSNPSVNRTEFCVQKVSSTYSTGSEEGICQEGYVYISIFERLLMLASDIELNPGPTTMDDILAAIKTSENKVLGEIQSVRCEISELKTGMKALKDSQAGLQAQIDKIIGEQTDINEKSTAVWNNIEELWGWKETADADILALANNDAETNDRLDEVDNKIEQLQKKSIEDQMRIFGLHIQEDYSEEKVVTEVIDKVLKVANPGVKWQGDDITRVRVIRGKEKDTTLVIVRFRFADDKFRVFSGREALREVGIRVGDDLTFKQRETLRKLRNEGKSGYYYKGKLQIRQDQSQTDKNNFSQQRVFVQAVRKVKQPASGPSDGVSTPSLEASDDPVDMMQ